MLDYLMAAMLDYLMIKFLMRLYRQKLQTHRQCTNPCLGRNVVCTLENYKPNTLNMGAISNNDLMEITRLSTLYTSLSIQGVALPIEVPFFH
jgi:hypothetical protein